MLLLPLFPIVSVSVKNSAEHNRRAGNLVHTLGVCSYCACTALGRTIYILIYAPNKNRVIVVGKMWPSCFYLGKTYSGTRIKMAWFKSIFFFSVINSLLFVSLHFITFSPPAGFNIFHALWSPERQWTWTFFK